MDTGVVHMRAVATYNSLDQRNVTIKDLISPNHNHAKHGVAVTT